MADEKPEDKTEAEKARSKDLNRLPISEAVLLTAVTASAYFFAFLYERGYTSYFGIPTQFINVNLTTLLIFGAGIFTLLYTSANIIDAFLPYMPKHPYLAHYVSRLSMFLLVFVLIPIFILRDSSIWFFLFLLGMWFIPVFITLVIPLIVHRKLGSWEKIYDAALEKEIQQNLPGRPGLFSSIGTRYGVKNLGLLLYLVFFSSLLSGMAGGAEAENEKTFLVLNTSPEMVVLRASGENMICAPFDRNAREVKKSFSVRKIADDPNLVMNLEAVGPLKPVNKLASESIAPSPTPIPEPTPTSTPTPATPSPTPSPLDRKPIVN